jgi:hypothetical protein
MQKQFYIPFVAIVVFACAQTNNERNTSSITDSATAENKTQTEIVKPADLFSLSEAEKIFGESAHLKDSSTKTNNKGLIYQCEYKSNTKDTANRSIYFMFENYKEVSAAKQAYSFIRSANENHEGIKVLKNVGDEAYFHSDYEGFYFILARKGTKMMRMKVNKITRNTSQQEFHRVTKNIVANM